MNTLRHPATSLSSRTKRAPEAPVPFGVGDRVVVAHPDNPGNCLAKQKAEGVVLEIARHGPDRRSRWPKGVTVVTVEYPAEPVPWREDWLYRPRSMSFGHELEKVG